MSWWSRRWLPWAWADVLVKRLIELGLAYGALLLLVLWLKSMYPDGGASLGQSQSGRKHVVLVPVLAALFFFLRALYRVVVHPVRAALTGRTLSEQAVAEVPTYRGVFPDSAKPASSDAMPPGVEAP